MDKRAKKGRVSIALPCIRRLAMAQEEKDNLFLQAYRMGYAAGKTDAFLESIKILQESKNGK